MHRKEKRKEKRKEEIYSRRSKREYTVDRRDGECKEGG